MIGTGHSGILLGLKNRLLVADRLRELDLPVLFITSDDGRLVAPKDSKEVSERVPCAEFVYCWNNVDISLRRNVQTHLWMQWANF